MLTKKVRNCLEKLPFLCISLLVLGTVFPGCSKKATTDAAVKFPQKAVTLICAYGAGGGTDLAMRIMGEFAGKSLGQSVVIENKTGGAGSIGLLAALDARRDGYTLASATVDLLTLPLLGITDRIKADTFEVLAAINGEPAAIIVKADSSWSNLKDFLADAKNRPGQISLANAGAGNIWHLSAIGLEDATGVSFNHVPYQDGAASALTGLLGGHVDAVVCSPAEAAANIASGVLKVLAVAGDKRLDAFPDVPTYRENGIDLVIVAVRGAAVLADVPAAEKTILREAFSNAVNDPECKRKILDAKMTYMPMDAGQFQALLASMKPAFEKAIAIYNSQK